MTNKFKIINLLPLENKKFRRRKVYKIEESIAKSPIGSSIKLTTIHYKNIVDVKYEYI